MDWLEVIRVRPNGGTAEAALAHIASLGLDFEVARGLVAARTYSQVGLTGDVALLLRWRQPPAPRRTALGLAVAESLRPLGLVDHSVWAPSR